MSGITATGRAGRLVRALASLAGLLTVLTGPPVALARFGGWPLPRHWPTRPEWAAMADRPLTPTTVRDAAICLMWLLWAIVTALVACDLADRIRRRPALRRPRWRLAAPFHTVANSLIGTVLLGISAVASRGLPTAVGPTSNTPAVPAAPATVGPAAAAVAPLPPGALVVLAADRHYVYTVHRGDTLWHIAEAWLGDPNRWSEIYQLNRDQYDRHGRMRHGDHIETGWVLVLPGDATPPPSAAPSTPPAGHPPPGPAPAVATPTTPAPPPPSAARSTGDPGTARTGPGADHRASTPAAHGPRHADDPASSERPRSNTDGIDLGEMGWVAVPLATAVTALAALAWIQRRRRYRPRSPGPDRRSDRDLRPMPRSIAAIHKAREDLTASEDHMDQGAGDTYEATIVTAAALGVHGERTVRLNDIPMLGVGLDGPGASAAARGVLAAALAAGGPWAAHHEASVVTTQTDLVTLLGPAAHRYAMDRLHTAATLEQALNHAEHELLRRARSAGDDLTGVPEPDEDEPRPPSSSSPPHLLDRSPPGCPRSSPSAPAWPSTASFSAHGTAAPPGTSTPTAPPPTAGG